ncbi:MAG: hypothetical protein INQ03_00290 [Candidatus Heimdallarchaeota archaeon]|nr:hypothetical protein [Candidatus Heimdallarchaeota archaeon]
MASLADLSAIDLVAGFSSMLMLIVGVSMAIKTILIWREKRDNLILLTSLLFFSLPSPWLGTTVRLLGYMFDLNINYDIVVYLFAWSVPTLVISWCYITAALLPQPWAKKVVLGISLVPGIIFFITVYLLGHWSYGLIDNSIYFGWLYGTIPNIMIYIYGALGILFVLPVYVYFSIKSTKPLFKFKTRMIAIAVTLFTIAGVWDSGVTQVIGLIVLLRVFLLLSLVSLYLGYITPDWIKSRYD